MYLYVNICFNLKHLVLKTLHFKTFLFIMNLTINKGGFFLQKIKILAVAPYEGMADLITEIGEKREDIELTVQIGDLNI